MKNLLASALVLLAAVATRPSDAALINDTNYVIDTTRNLRWLDLTETNDISFNTIGPMLAPGGSLAGWRYATEVEVEGMFGEVGLPVINSVSGLGGPLEDAFDRLIALFGDTVITGDGSVLSGALGLVDYGPTADGLTQGYLPEYRQRVGAYMYRDRGEIFVQTNVGTGTDVYNKNEGLPTSYCCFEPPENARYWFGHWLVQDVQPPAPIPEPHTSMLLLAGLALLGFKKIERKRTAELRRH